MRKILFVAALGLAAPLVPAQAQIGIKLGGGVNFSSISSMPAPYVKSSDVGYYVGGAVRFGQFLFIQPGAWYQQQSVQLNDGTRNDNVPIRSWLFPVMAGVNVNLVAVGVQLGIGPTVTFTSGVGGNDFGINKDQVSGTRWGYQVGADVRILMINVDLNWQQDFTRAFRDGAGLGDGNLHTFRIGIGFSI